jgi:hydrogenase small subunit
MKISRREFLKWCSASAVAVGLNKMDIIKLESMVMAAETTPPVIWLQGSGCSGCSISLMNTVRQTTIDDLLLNKISMKYHSNLMTASGDLAISSIDETISNFDGQFILVVEGGIPTKDNGIYCVIGEKNGQPWTLMDAVQEIGPKAKYVIAAGTCSSYGGAPAAGPNPTEVQTLSTILNGMTANKVINLPGCPVHPYNLTKTIVDLLLYGMPSLTYDGKPRALYGTEIHERCPYEEYNEVSSLGEIGCYERLGCMGPRTDSNCPSRKWNNQVNWCIESRHQCIGCSDKNFLKSSIYGGGYSGGYSGGYHD